MGGGGGGGGEEPTITIHTSAKERRMMRSFQK